VGHGVGMRVKLIQIDGSVPNLALMKLSHYYRERKGAEVVFTRSVKTDLFENYDLVLASAIFSTSRKLIDELKDYRPDAVIGGTAISEKPEDTIENFLGLVRDYKGRDYSLYPEFQYSIGMTHVGCHLNCGFCCVRNKEGVNRPTDNIARIYRGEPFPRRLILLDNDFQSRDNWQGICNEIIDGDFEVAFIQGINIRALTMEHAKYFKRIKFRDRNFGRKRFYCAWDNPKDKAKIERGLTILEEAGIKRSDVTPYFITNYYSKGLTLDVWDRFLSMAERGLRPYCMVWHKWELPPNDDLKIFQNWVNSHNAYVDPSRDGFDGYKKYRLREKAIVQL
jgi:hypothetical protein